MPDILLVEDSVVDVEIMREALTDLDFKGNLHVVEDGEVALQFLRKEENFQSVTRPDIVLLDLNLPKVNGQEVLQSASRPYRCSCSPRRVPISMSKPPTVWGQTATFKSQAVTTNSC